MYRRNQWEDDGGKEPSTSSPSGRSPLDIINMVSTSNIDRNIKWVKEEDWKFSRLFQWLMKF